LPSLKISIERLERSGTLNPRFSRATRRAGYRFHRSPE
jgi:hypothetical protein